MECENRREKRESDAKEKNKRKKKKGKGKKKRKEKKIYDFFYKFRPKINQKLYNYPSKYILFALKILVII